MTSVKKDDGLVPVSKLKEQGWTDSTIARFLGEPDKLARNPRYAKAAPMRLYSLARANQARGIPGCSDAMAKASIRRVAASAVANKKASDLIARIEAMTVKVSVLSSARVTGLAIDSYNRRQEDRAFERGYDPGDHVHRDSDPAFLERITVNYIRHNLTSYDRTIEGLFGAVGKEAAIEAMRSRVFAAIVEAYPYLTDEVKRQIKRDRMEGWQ